ncbi:MAG: trehalose-phosphatase [Alphaproteobacteria bacterium]|nr:trehalose-phosphatase [Alphaproteobacteria bacterium]
MSQDDPEQERSGAVPRGHPIIAAAEFDALLFDLDGVVTRTADVHAHCWKRVFDAFLTRCAARSGQPAAPFDIERDYRAYVDGKPRHDGIRSFLASRGIELPLGSPGDDPDLDTVSALADRKNACFRSRLKSHGIGVYETSVALIRRARSLGLRTAVVSASKNCADVLEAAGLADLFDARVDGCELARLQLSGKPAPDSFVEAAQRLGSAPERTVVFEDAVAGVEAGKRGGMGLVVGVDRGQESDALRRHGADLVVADLGEIALSERTVGSAQAVGMDSALDDFERITDRIGDKTLAVFLDYDGTLTPIVERPENALLPTATKVVLDRLARLCPVAVISGRKRPDVERLVGLPAVTFAGSHGFDIVSPRVGHIEPPEARSFVPDIESAVLDLRTRLADIPGVIVEDKTFAAAVHYRLVAKAEIPAVEEAVAAVAADRPRLRRTEGKKVHELRPRLDWDKGKAVLWLLEALPIDTAKVLPLFIGDDETDEDAFAALRDQGITILVAEQPGESAAQYRLGSPDQVRTFLTRLADHLEAGPA